MKNENLMVEIDEEEIRDPNEGIFLITSNGTPLERTEELFDLAKTMRAGGNTVLIVDFATDAGLLEQVRHEKRAPRIGILSYQDGYSHMVELYELLQDLIETKGYNRILFNMETDTDPSVDMVLMGMCAELQINPDILFFLLQSEDDEIFEQRAPYEQVFLVQGNGDAVAEAKEFLPLARAYDEYELGSVFADMDLEAAELEKLQKETGTEDVQIVSLKGLDSEQARHKILDLKKNHDLIVIHLSPAMPEVEAEDWAQWAQDQIEAGRLDFVLIHPDFGEEIRED